MTIPHISPEDAKKLIDEGAVLVDIRDPDEHARERIPHAQLVPISVLDREALPQHGPAMIFHCRSGNRTLSHAQTLKDAASCDVYVLDGGLEAWKKAGLPVDVDRKQPLPMMRQVQIAAGSLVLLGALLGVTLNPWFFGLSTFVGAGLTFAGITGTCALAQVLSRMPWNRQGAL